MHIGKLFLVTVFMLGIVSSQTNALSRLPDTRSFEALFAISVAPDTLSIDVKSTGCTTEKSYTFSVDKRTDTTAVISIVRIEPDPCDALPHRITLRYQRADIGLTDVTQFTIRNPFAAPARF